MVFGTAGVVLLYYLMREVYGRRGVAAGAAALAAIHPMLAGFSASVRTEAGYIALVTAALLFAGPRGGTQTYRERRRRRGALRTRLPLSHRGNRRSRALRRLILAVRRLRVAAMDACDGASARPPSSSRYFCWSPRRTCSGCARTRAIGRSAANSAWLRWRRPARRWVSSSNGARWAIGRRPRG